MGERDPMIDREPMIDRDGAMPAWHESWRLFALIAAGLAAMALAVAAAHGFSVDGTRAAIRATARSSLLLFCLAYSASALARLRPGRSTSWLRRNRRFLGLGFAASHGLHALAIVAFARSDPAAFAGSVSLATFVVGLPAYAIIAAMAATSFDATASWLGPRAWQRLHRAGAHVLWLAFAGSVGMRAGDPFYWPFLAILLAALAARLAAWRFRPATLQSAPSAPPAAALPHSSAT
jgi:DMSO/TMAO reductase YedYZ heme-binding membrane subunit